MTPSARLIFRRPRVTHDHNWLGGLLLVAAYFIAQSVMA